MKLLHDLLFTDYGLMSYFFCAYFYQAERLTNKLCLFSSCDTNWQE